jgi:hypothetical protein
MRFLKHCKGCEKKLPKDSFGLNNSIKDKKNKLCKSCVNLRAEKIRSTPENKQYFKDYFRNTRNNPQRRTKEWLRRVKVRALEKGIEFNLNESDIEMPDKCPILGIPLVFGSPLPSGGVSGNTPSLDRKDNSKGYIKGNVQVISYRANTLKRDASLEELRLIAAWVINTL